MRAMTGVARVSGNIPRKFAAYIPKQNWQGFYSFARSFPKSISLPQRALIPADNMLALIPRKPWFMALAR